MEWLYASVNIIGMVVCLVAGAFIGGYAILIRQKWRRIKVGFNMFKGVLPWVKATGAIVLILTIVGLYSVGVLT
jgi:hypothetical protein